MFAQVIRWLMFTALVAAVVIAIFVAWWLALIIALVALAFGALRRLLGGRPRERRSASSVILEGECVEVKRESRTLEARDEPPP